MIRACAGGAIALVLAAAGCGPRVTHEATRIIFVTLDTTRADRIGCYGFDQAVTPNLDALAGEGVLFEQAISPVPTTLPSHSTMFTGLYPPDHKVRYNILFKLDESATTLAEVLSDAGFSTAAFPATQVIGEPFGLRQGFETWAKPPKRDMEKTQYYKPLSAMRPADEGVDLALDWLQTNENERQFLWLHFYDAHWPYDPPFPFASSHREHPYDGEIAFMDREFGRLMDYLRADPAWDRTVVIAVGDHGEGLYDHGERYHAMLIYESTQWVPLIVRAPGADRARVADPVTLADLMPTVLDLTGVETDLSFRGVSLRPALEGARLPTRDIYFETVAGAVAYGWQELFGVRSGPYKLVDSTTPELFDLREDPEELTNLASFEKSRIEELRAALEEFKKPLGGVDAASGTDIELDAESLAVIKSLGYSPGSLSGPGTNAPNPRDLIYLEPEILDAQSAQANGRWNDVERIAMYVMEKDDTNRWGLNALIASRVQQQRPAEALAPALRLVELIPESEQPYESIAQVYHAMDQTVEALGWLERGLQEVPDSETLHFLRAVAAFDVSRDDVCTELVPAALTAHADSGRTLILRARCEARAGEPHTALATIRQATELGIKDLRVVGQAPDFAEVVALPEYQELSEELAADSEVASATDVSD